MRHKKQHQFIIKSLNCQSLKLKCQTVLDYLFESKVDIALLQETWLKRDDLNVYSEIHELGYKTYNLTKNSRRGGGLSIIFRPNLTVKRIYIKQEGGFTTFENICCIATANDRKFKIVNLYRPPYSAANPKTVRNFLDEFDIFLALILEHKGILLIFGDFNVNYLDK